MTEIRVPTLGESVTEATIGKWFKQPGEAVAVDEPLVELETDKVTIEVPAPAAGFCPRSSPRTARRSRSADCSVRSKPAELRPPQQSLPIRSIRPNRPARPRTSRSPRPSRRRHRKRRLPHRRRQSPSRRLPMPRWRHRCAGCPRRAASMPLRCPARARTAASPRATCWRRSSARRRSRRRSPNPPPPSRCGRRRPPTMQHARSACA